MKTYTIYKSIKIKTKNSSTPYGDVIIPTLTIDNIDVFEFKEVKYIDEIKYAISNVKKYLIRSDKIRIDSGVIEIIDYENKDAKGIRFNDGLSIVMTLNGEIGSLSFCW